MPLPPVEPDAGSCRGAPQCLSDTWSTDSWGHDVPNIGPHRLRRWVARRVGHRGAFLLFLALLDLVYAFGLAFPTPQARRSPTYAFLAEVPGSLYLWAALWLIAGILCGIYAFRRRDAIGYFAAMFVKAIWALMFLLGWLFAGVERGYLSAAIWGAFAFIVWLIAGWPEPPKDRR